MGQMLLMLATAALCAATLSCAGPASGSPGPDWDLSGVMRTVEPAPSATRVTVELAEEAAAEPGRAVLLVGPATEVEVQRADGTIVRGSMADLVPGARVLARHTGAELRSLPPQYRATHVRVIARP